MTVLETLQKLPEQCAATNSVNGEPIIIKRGVSGYYRAPINLIPDEYNRRHNITAAQVEAMEIGSMFGWEVPGADPDNFNK